MSNKRGSPKYPETSKVLIIKMSKEQVGFMKAPDINAKKSMSKSTRPPPIANPPNFSSHLYGGLLLK